MIYVVCCEIYVVCSAGLNSTDVKHCNPFKTFLCCFDVLHMHGKLSIKFPGHTETKCEICGLLWNTWFTADLNSTDVKHCYPFKTFLCCFAVLHMHGKLSMKFPGHTETKCEICGLL